MGNGGTGLGNAGGHCRTTRNGPGVYWVCVQPKAPFDCFIANSLPIRLVDAMHVAHVRQVRVNRGASGIDGNIATIMGLCMAETNVPLLAVVGDLAAVYGPNSFLLMPKVRRPVSILIINNGGGDIFSRLPFVPIAQISMICSN